MVDSARCDLLLDPPPYLGLTWQNPLFMAQFPAGKEKKRKEKRQKKLFSRTEKKLLVFYGVHSPMPTPPPPPKKKKKNNLPYHLGSTFDKKKS
jgi:hypothetical protein